MEEQKYFTAKGMLSYRDMFIKYGIAISVLNHRVHTLQIKGRFIGNRKYFNSYEVDKILRQGPTQYDVHPRKITIIEYYTQGYKGREIAQILGISTKLTYDAIREFNVTGHIVVQSKLNGKTRANKKSKPKLKNAS